MIFTSLPFVVFFMALLFLLRFFPSKSRVILLAASYIFYALMDRSFLALLVSISVLNWGVGRAIDENRSAAGQYLAMGVFVDAAVLLAAKYMDFFAENICRLFGHSWTFMNIILPLGVSYYTFQAISYIADVYKGRIKAESSLLNVMLYIGFFPQIVSGPIVKAHNFMHYLHDDEQRIKLENLSCGFQRFVVGIFKKLVIADRLSVCVGAVYGAPEVYSGVSILLAAVSYALELYYDFSGYSDMAIGIAEMLGFDIGINFNLPYLARNPSDFWNRWHISLSSWFKEYVYIPLGGNRKGKLRTFFNMMVTMLLSGLWHGANWAFVIWGAAHAAISIAHKIFSDIMKKTKTSRVRDESNRASESIPGASEVSLSSGASAGAKKRTSGTSSGTWAADGPAGVITAVISILLTDAAVMLLWIPFRLNDLSKTAVVLKRIFTNAAGAQYIYVYTIIFALFLAFVQLYAVVFNKGNDVFRPLDLRRFGPKIVFIIFIIIIGCFAYFGNSAFIYANF